MSAMNLSFRTLKGDKFKLEATGSETVTDLKKKVVARYDDTDHASYRLIYKGKILDPAKTLSDSGVSEDGFIVVMPPKRAAPSKPAAPAAPKTTAPPASTASAPSTSAPVVKRTTPAAAPAAAPSSSAAAPPASGAGSSLVTGAEYEATVKRIAEMGFPEAEVKRALRAAFNNPDRAVDYLFNGIPASAAPPAPPSTPPQGAATGAAGANPTAARPGQPFDMFQGGQGGRSGGGGGGGGGNLEFLRRSAPFNNMRRMIQSNPSVVHSILQQLESTDPHLLQLINNNREEFLNLLNTPVDGDGGAVDDAAMEQLAAALANSGGSGAGGGGGGGTIDVMVTPEENEVIQRLMELGNTMGLGQMHVVQAWLACDKDENLAANYLLNNSEELRQQQAEDAAALEAARNNQGGGGPGQGGQPPQPPQGGS